MTEPAHVLVVDDEPIVLDVLGRYLSREGYGVETASDGEAALRAVEDSRPDLVLLDLMLPKVDGIEVCRWVRSRADGTAVIMLTARGTETDRIAGLDLGADDYITKPFSPREVVARVRAVLRRLGPATKGDAVTIVAGDLEIDPRSREVRRSGTTLHLTPKEFDLLHVLAAEPGRVFSRIDLLDELWDFAFDGDPATVTVHIRRLREKVEDDPSSPRHLVTVWGAGYRFDP
ncbi:MAG: response regulator transcription factor [Actinomycetota bacterium]